MLPDRWDFKREMFAHPPRKAPIWSTFSRSLRRITNQLLLSSAKSRKPSDANKTEEPQKETGRCRGSGSESSCWEAGECFIRTGWQFHTIQTTLPLGGAHRTFPRYKRNKQQRRRLFSVTKVFFLKIFFSVKKNHYLSIQTQIITLWINTKFIYMCSIFWSVKASHLKGRQQS